MFFKDALNAVRSAEQFVTETQLAYAIYADACGFIVALLTQPTGLELEIIKP